MGCWNATCMLSHLPIFSGEETYAFLIARMPHEGRNWYASSRWTPVAMFTGKYDDYGGLDDIKNERSHLELLQKFGFDIKSFSEWPLYDFEAEEVSIDGKVIPVSIIMTRKDITDEMLQAFKEHYPDYEKNIRYFHEQFLSCREELLAFHSNPDSDVCNTPKNFAYTIVKENTHFAFNNLCGIYNMDIIGASILEEAALKYEDLAQDVLTMNMITTMLDIMRMAWHCPSGSGSQSTDTTLNHILCDKIIKNINDSDTDQSY